VTRRKTTVLRRFLGLAAVEEVWRQSSVGEDESLAAAYEELRAVRREESARR
jgi:hypothetical protein